MKADSASHLIRHPISFELFLLLYLICALLLQKVNIYKTNYHRIDGHIVVFIVVVLGRRLAWCSLQFIQTRSRGRPRLNLRFSAWRTMFSDYAKGGMTRHTLWTLLTWNWSMNLKRLCVGLCTLTPMVWAVLCLVQSTSVFNMLFLFYPLLLYFSLFGFTLEPRSHRERFEPPKKFLEHTHVLSPSSRQPFSPLLAASVEILAHHHHSPAHQGHAHFNSHSSVNNSSSSNSNNSPQTRVRHRGGGEKLVDSYSSGSSGQHIFYKSQSSQAQQQHYLNHNRQANYKDRTTATDPQLANSISATQASRKGHVLYTNGRIYSGKASTEHARLHGKHHADSIPVYATHLNVEWNQGSGQAGIWYLPSSPDEVRSEVDILVSDLIVRLKQLLFNSILCAYYVGFIPIQFANGHLYYDRWWCMEHTFLVWANSFVILSSHLLPPSYCHLLYQCSRHLGCWTRSTQSDNAHKWSPDVIWACNKVVQWNGDFFKADGPQNVAIPSNSSQEMFYVLFHSRLSVHSWLLILQVVIVSFQFVVLLRSVFWFQTLSMSILLAFNSFILYRLLYNRLWCRIHATLT